MIVVDYDVDEYYYWYYSFDIDDNVELQNDSSIVSPDLFSLGYLWFCFHSHSMIEMLFVDTIHKQ